MKLWKCLSRIRKLVGYNLQHPGLITFMLMKGKIDRVNYMGMKRFECIDQIMKDVGVVGMLIRI